MQTDNFSSAVSLSRNRFRKQYQHLSVLVLVWSPAPRHRLNTSDRMLHKAFEALIAKSLDSCPQFQVSPTAFAGPSILLPAFQGMPTPGHLAQQRSHPAVTHPHLLGSVSETFAVQTNSLGLSSHMLMTVPSSVFRAANRVAVAFVVMGHASASALFDG